MHGTCIAPSQRFQKPHITDLTPPTRLKIAKFVIMSLQTLPRLPLALIVNHLDCPAALSALLQCSRDLLDLRNDAHVQALWLAIYRPRTAFNQAARARKEAVFLRLLALQQQDPAMGLEGSHALQLRLAAQMGFSSAVAELLKVPAAVTELSITAVECWRTPLHLAAMGGHTQAMHLLLGAPDAQHSISAGDKQGKTPLHWAVMKGHTQAVQLLLGAPGAHCSLSSRDRQGRMPLHLAVMGGHTQAVQLLLGALGAQHSVSAGDIEGRTPLHLAVMGGHTQAVQLLLEVQGTKQILSAKDSRGKTPFALAREYGQQEIVKLLQMLQVSRAQE